MEKNNIIRTVRTYGIVGVLSLSAIASLINVHQVTNDINNAEVVNRVKLGRTNSGNISHAYYCGFDDNGDGEIDRVKEWLLMGSGRGICYMPREFTPQDKGFDRANYLFDKRKSNKK